MYQPEYHLGLFGDAFGQPGIRVLMARPGELETPPDVARLDD